MKKSLLILGILAFAIIANSQTTTIMQIDTVIVEEFKQTDEAGLEITSYRRLTRKEVRDYIEKIKLQNDYKADQLQMINLEIEMINDRLKSAKEQKEKLRAEIDDNKRRMNEYRNLINR